MNKFSSMIENLKARREAMVSEGAFSLIDVVVTVAIVVALSVGGFIAYSGIVENAKSSATAAAADQVYTASLVAENDGFAGNTTPQTPTTIAADYNTSSTDVKVVISPEGSALKVIAVHKDAKDGDTALTAATPYADLLTQSATNKLVKARG